MVGTAVSLSVPLNCPSPRFPATQTPMAALQSLSPGTREPVLGARGCQEPAWTHTACRLAPALFSSPAKADGGKEQLTYESGEDEEEEEEDFKPSDGSENEMETEMLDYV